jgi:hypothetical protein
MTKHKVYDAEFKVKVVLEVIKGEKTTVMKTSMQEDQ